MKKYFLFGIPLIILISLVGVFAYSYQATGNLKAENYYLPEGFTGCAYIIYNQEDKPPLKVKDGVIDHYFNQDGFLLTSSPPDVGWEGKQRSGFHKGNYYVGDKKLDFDEVIAQSLGEAKTPTNEVYTYEIIEIGKAEACEREHVEIFQKVLNK